MGESVLYRHSLTGNPHRPLSSTLEVAGNPIPPNFCVVYPIILDAKRFLWIMKLTTALLRPSDPSFPYQEAIMTTDIPTEMAEKEEIPTETLAVEQLVTI